MLCTLYIFICSSRQPMKSLYYYYSILQLRKLRQPNTGAHLLETHSLVPQNSHKI